MKCLHIFSRPAPYLIWLVLSGTGLVVAQRVDPYVFALAAFVSAGISGALALASLLSAIRQLGWALLGAGPTVLAFMLLSTYRWA